VKSAGRISHNDFVGLLVSQRPPRIASDILLLARKLYDEQEVHSGKGLSPLTNEPKINVTADFTLTDMLRAVVAFPNEKRKEVLWEVDVQVNMFHITDLKMIRDRFERASSGGSAQPGNESDLERSTSIQINRIAQKYRRVREVVLKVIEGKIEVGDSWYLSLYETVYPPAPKAPKPDSVQLNFDLFGPLASRYGWPVRMQA
jgi:hypothetical protein